MPAATDAPLLTFKNELPRADALLGVVRAQGVDVRRWPPGFDAALQALVARRRDDLSAAEEQVRLAARDLLRNGRYKPTGRGKPASEYLIRAAREGRPFPRINAPVDVNNYVSLASVLPASLWDVDLAASDTFVFRLGRPGEAYVFNSGGQTIALEDLVVGCRVPESSPGLPGRAEEPIVNPVKDSLRTKTTEETSRVAACIYAPSEAVPHAALESLCADFAGLLAGCGADVATAYAVVGPGETVTV